MSSQNAILGDGARAGWPSISVLMPVRNESGTIGPALDSIADQTYPVDLLEVIVMDGRSEDTTVDEAITWARAHPQVRIRIVENPARLQAAGFNIGLEQAGGDLVFIMSSAHGGIDADYIETMVRALQSDESIWVVGGHARARGTTRWGDAVARALRHRFSLGGPDWRMGGAARDTDHVGYGLYRRLAFDKVGGFSEHLVINEDYELTHRIRSAGGRVRLEPASSSYYLTRATPAKLALQYLTYGRYKAHVLLEHPGSTKLRHVIPFAFVTALAAMAVATPVSRAARIGLAATLAVYAAASAHAARKVCGDDPGLVPDVVAANAIMHVCYGVGNVVGAADVARHGAHHEEDSTTTTEGVLLWSHEPESESPRFVAAEPA